MTHEQEVLPGEQRAEEPPLGDLPEEGGATGEPVPPTTFEAWLEGQADEVKALVADHIGGLKSALQSEREQRRAERKEFERKLREAASELEQGSEARKELEGIAGDLEVTERRAAFYEEAHGAGVTNLRLAWLAVQQDEASGEPQLLDRHGRVDMERLKKAYPELFARPKPPAGNAGAGTTSPPAPATGMNEFIRAAAGRPHG